MKLIYLISCMHQKDAGIIARSNVQSDVVVVNQCDRDSVEEFDFVNKKGRTCHAKFICTTERGLSKSRNMAIRNAWGDVCQICDDDETFPDDAEEIVTRAYEQNPGCGVIVFALKRLDCAMSYPVERKSLGFVQILKTSSLQVTLSRNLLRGAGVQFDEKLGSGTGNGGGEENKFLLDCRRSGLKMMYVPEEIATVHPGASQWFKGYTAKHFQNKGWSTRRILGFFKGYAFLLYNAINHRREFTKDGLSFGKVLWNIHKGFFEKR